MAQEHAAGRIFAGAFTVVGLGLVWLIVVVSLPSQQELSANEPQLSQRMIVTSKAQTPSEPELDLSIPGVPPGRPIPRDQEQSEVAGTVPSAAAQLDPRASQIARLRCDAEVAQMCPDSPEGPGRKQCLERRVKELPAACQQQLRERLVKWREERSRLAKSCQADVKRWCSAVTPGEGQILKCLQEHAQDLSERCYETLPKGTVYFAQ
jgi:Cysteine rich repeat